MRSTSLRGRSRKLVSVPCCSTDASNLCLHRWLRPLFFKLRDPNLQEVHLKMKWRTMLGG